MLREANLKHEADMLCVLTGMIDVSSFTNERIRFTRSIWRAISLSMILMNEEIFHVHAVFIALFVGSHWHWRLMCTRRELLHAYYW